MSLENPITFIRSIKGPSCSILMALLFNRRPMTNQELQRWTGYSESAVTDGLQLLTDLGWITAIGARGPWGLNTERQLPLMEAASPEIPGSASSFQGSNREIPGSNSSSGGHTSREIHGSASSPSPVQGTNREIHGSLPSSSLIKNQNSLMKKEEKKESKDGNESKTGNDAAQSEDFLKNRQAFYAAGIREPTAGRLSRLAHVNPAYIAAHVEQAKAQGLAVGSAIYRIQHGWPVKPRKPVLTIEEKIRRFLNDYRDESP